MKTEAGHRISEVFEAHFEHLLLLAIGYVKDPDEAYDIIMGIFEKLLQVPENRSFENSSIEEVKGYLFLVTKHRCLDHLKKEKGRLAIQGFLQLSKPSVERNTTFDVFEKEAINRMLGHLGNQEQTILQAHLDGFSNEEIALKHGITYNTVKNTLVNARKKVRKLWSLFLN